MNKLTKLQQLINELCPNGITYQPLEKCCEILDGKRKPITKAVRELGEYPYYGANGIQDYVSNYLFDGEFVLVGEDGSVLTEKGTPVVNWAEGKIWVNNHAHVIKGKEEVLLRFVYYYLQLIDITNYVHGNIPKFTGRDFKALLIPVLPLPVQEEIVRILDELTEKTDELISELNAELDERKKQYEYFQNQLFTKSEDMQYVDVPLGDVIVSLKTGLNPRKNFKLNTPDSCCPYITGKDIFNNKVNVTARTDEITMDAVALINKRACIETDDLLFASTGTGTVGRMAIVEDYKGDWSISESIYAIKVNKDVVLPKFLMYLLYTENVISQYKTKITKASVPHLKVSDLLKVKISIPSIQEQKRIIKAAETFTATQDLLISNLMHEIENRKKQYEYYRDKLLTF